MQSVSFKIWTRVTVSISHDDNRYTTGTSVGFGKFVLNFGYLGFKYILV